MQKIVIRIWEIDFPDIWRQHNLFQLSPPPVANYHICSWNRRWIISGGMTSIRKLVSLSRSGVVAPEVWTLISRFLWHNLDKELSWGHLKNVFRFSLFLKGKLLGVNIDLICNNKEITLRHFQCLFQYLIVFGNCEMHDNNWGEADNQVGPEGGQMWALAVEVATKRRKQCIWGDSTDIICQPINHVKYNIYPLFCLFPWQIIAQNAVTINYN